MTPRKAVSIALVLLLHAVIGYAFVTGLAYQVIKKAAQDLKVVDVQEAAPTTRAEAATTTARTEVRAATNRRSAADCSGSGDFGSADRHCAGSAACDP
jgi:hypothetical protein